MGMHKHDCIEIGRRIKDAREERRMIQEEVGRMFGVPFQMVQRWERGEQLTAERIFAIAAVLKVDPTWLFDGKLGIPPQLCRALSDTSVQIGRAKSGAELLDIFYQRDNLRRQMDPLLGIPLIPISSRAFLRGILPALTPASQS